MKYVVVAEFHKRTRSSFKVERKTFGVFDDEKMAQEWMCNEGPECSVWFVAPIEMINWCVASK